MLKKVAVTGAIGAGKTTVCRFFQELGAHVVFADEIVKQLFLDPKVQKEILSAFGTLDQKALAKIVFEDRKKLELIEKILHPKVLKQIEEEAKKQKASLFIAEIPLLYEIGAESAYDAVIAVVAKPSFCKKRFIEKGFKESEFDLRSQRQEAPQIKAQKADYVIVNEGSLEALKKAVLSLYEKLL